MGQHVRIPEAHSIRVAKKDRPDETRKTVTHDTQQCNITQHCPTSRTCVSHLSQRLVVVLQCHDSRVYHSRKNYYMQSFLF